MRVAAASRRAPEIHGRAEMRHVEIHSPSPRGWQSQRAGEDAAVAGRTLILLEMRHAGQAECPGAAVRMRAAPCEKQERDAEQERVISASDACEA